MNLSEKEQCLARELAKLTDEMGQCEYLLMLGSQTNPDSSLRKDERRISGCKTSIWLRTQKTDGIIRFSAESDSVIVQGILNLMHRLYDGQPVQEIRRHPPAFLTQFSDLVVNPEIKTNGIQKVYQKLSV